MYSQAPLLQTVEVDFYKRVYNNSDIEQKVVHMLAMIFRWTLRPKRLITIHSPSLFYPPQFLSWLVFDFSLFEQMPCRLCLIQNQFLDWKKDLTRQHLWKSRNFHQALSLISWNTTQDNYQTFQKSYLDTCEAKLVFQSISCNRFKRESWNVELEKYLLLHFLLDSHAFK